MLLELRIENFAVIERLSVRLNDGLNALTGETGAGKSIIVGALSLLLGERASSDAVRGGTGKAVVEGVFDIADQSAIQELLQQQGIEAEEGLLILRREVAAEGRSRAWVNGAASTATLLSQIGGLLVDLHGQHEHQTLLRADEQRAVLDAFAGASELAEMVRSAHARLKSARSALADLERRKRAAETRADYLRFQASEIEAAHVRAGEDDELDLDIRRLEHSEELARHAARLHQDLYADDRSATARLSDLRRVLEHLIRIDESQNDARELIDTAYYALEELGQRMGEYATSVEHDPARLEKQRHRLDVLFRLKTKYGPTLADVAETLAAARTELGLLDQADDSRAALVAEESAASEELAAFALKLSGARNKGARKLERAVLEVLPQLGMSSAQFIVALEPNAEIGANGAENVQFRIAVNAGFEPRELARVASGGELSRIMLALKTILARLDAVPTLIFDEIDAGIGGRVAVQVAQQLREVSAHHQVFVITHLAQIASRADHQLLVEKVEREGTTLTRVSNLSGDERVRELARMLGGDPDSLASIQHARELLAGTK